MAARYEDCARINRISQETGIPCFVAYYRRYLPYSQKVRQMVADGEIGNVINIQIRFAQPPRALDYNSTNLPWRVDVYKRQEETTVAWTLALANTSTPTALIFSRQNIANLPAGNDYSQAAKGAYIVAGSDENPEDVYKRQIYGRKDYFITSPTYILYAF